MNILLGLTDPELTGLSFHAPTTSPPPISPFEGTLACDGGDSPGRVEACQCIAVAITVQVWDEADRPERFLRLGGPTGAAMPLARAHAEYIKPFRSAYDGLVFDRIPAVVDRYLGTGRIHRRLEIWKPSRQPKFVARGFILRVQAPEAFLLHWSLDEWGEARDTRSSPTALGIEFVDIPVAAAQLAPIRFTFRWLETGRWEGRDYEVATSDG